MKTKFATKSVAVFAALLVSALCARADDNPYSVEYTVNGYAGTEALTNFPVLVRLAAGSPVGFSYADCASGGADLAFTDDEGNVIPREIDTWNKSGESLVWVCVPVVTNGASFTMHYGDTYVAAQPACQTDGSVWSGAGYAGVWHLTDGHDSTTNGLDGSLVSGITAAADTKLGGALDFATAKMSVGTTTNSNLANGFSLEAWCYPRRLTDKAGKNGNAVFGKNAAMSVRIEGTKIRLTTPSVKDHDLIDCAIATNQWFHLGLTFLPNPATSGTGLIANQYKVYRDGVLKGTKGASRIPNLTDSAEMWIGGNQWSDQDFEGILDEVRLSYSIRSAAWIAASYATQHEDDFLSAGPRLGGAAPVLLHATVTPAYTDAQVSVLLATVGEGATSAAVSFAYGPEGGALSAPVVLAAAGTDGQTLSTNLTGLAAGTAYRYVFTAVNDLASPKSATVEGTFTTMAFSGPELAISSTKAGVDSESVSASVVNLGGADACDLYFSYGPAAEPLPTYTQVGTDMTAGETFSRVLTGLSPGTAYAYSFAATNNAGLGTITTGSFTAGIGFKRPDPDVAEFSRGVKFTVTGYTGSQELTNFPVLVRLSADSPAGFSYADFYNPGDVAGADLCFLDAAGNGIPHEIDTWDPTGESLVWVTLPRMVNGTEFSMWYRSSKNGSVICADNAWEDYTGVWHLGEGGDGVQTVHDSTANDLAGVTHANSLAVSVGRIGAARRNSTKSGNSAANGRILVSLGDANSPKRAAMDALADDGSSKTFTASFWFRPQGGADWCYLIGRKDDDKYAAWGVQMRDKADTAPKTISIYSAGTADNQNVQYANVQTSSGTWRKADVVWAGSTYKLYYDGVLKSSGNLNATKPAANGSIDFAFGGCAGSGYGSFNGDMDEVRVRAGDMGDDWVKADYDTQTSASFLSVGAVVSLLETPKPVATLALSDSGAKYAQFSGSIGSCGGEADECTVYAKVWKTTEEEPAAWTLLAGHLEAGDAFSKAVTGLDPETAYSYKIKAVNNLETPFDSEIEEGTFTTGGTGAGGTGGERYRVGNDYVHVFEVEPGSAETSFEFTPPDYVSSIRALVVAGGGPGGYRRGGGGGAGGLVYDAALAVSGGATYAINVGTGGVASASADAYGSNGGDSSIVGAGVSVTAAGGGAGGNGPSNGAGVAGGSGGGAGSGSTTVGAGTAGQGNAGGIRGVNGGNSTGGGGGGAVREGGSGSNDSPPSGGSGGQGFLTDISGTPTWYAGGGGGGGAQAGSATNLGSPGGGGDGGGGRGGMAVPNGTVNPSFGPAAVAGQNGLGGGGGGGSDVSGFYEGANGGNGIVIVRYTVEGTGAGSAEPVVSLTGATYAGNLKITGTYRVAWAGEGSNNANVYIKWGYSANSLTHSVLVAPDAIGTGSFEITVPVDQTTIYLRAMADNGTAQGLSDEIVPIYIPEYSGVVPGDPTIPVLGTVSLSAVDGAFARVSGTVTSFGTAGAGEDAITNCVVYALVGTSDNVSRMTAHQEMFVTAGEQFSYAIDGLTPNTTYYWCLEARNSAGVAVATQVGSFTTLPEHTVANSINASGAQRTINLSGSLAQIGAGPTTVSVRWREGSGAWSDWTTVNTFDGSSASTAFNASHSSESWNTTIYWEVSFSNQCVTAAGEPVGDPWVTTQNGSYSPSDTATYTWQAVAGDWDGSWTNAAHWACNQADRRDYPDGSGVTVAFNNNTVATIEVPGDYTFGSWSIAKSGCDVTLVGEGTATSALRGNMAGGAVANSSWTFSALTFVESNGLDFGNTSVANNTITFTDGAVGSTGSGYLNLVGSNVWLVVEKGASFQRGVHNCTKDGGVRLDDGTISGNAFRTDYNWTATTNEWFIFKGAAPRLTATESFRNHSDEEAYLQNADTTFLFSVPRNGWAAAPLYAEYSSTEKFGGMLGDGEGGYVIAIDPESPAFTAAGTHAVQLVEWRSGIDTTYVRFADDLPENATLSWTYGWPSTLAEPENEGDAPTGVKATIVGRGKLTMILVW